jgi:hypothetical protein
VAAGMTSPFRQPPARLQATSMHGGVSSSKGLDLPSPTPKVTTCPKLPKLARQSGAPY